MAEGQDNTSTPAVVGFVPIWVYLSALFMIVGIVAAIGADWTEDRSIMAHFLPPSMPSVAATADAASKIAAVSSGFADTDVFWEMQGFDKPTIARIQAQKRRQRGMDAMSMFTEANGEAV